MYFSYFLYTLGMADKEVLGTTTISYKYQITIPKKVRNHYKFKEGDVIVYERESGRLYIRAGNDL